MIIDSGVGPDAASILSELNSEESVISDGDSFNDTRDEESEEEELPVLKEPVKAKPPVKKRRRDMVPVDPAFQPKVDLKLPASYSDAIQQRLAGWANR